MEEYFAIIIGTDNNIEALNDHLSRGFRINREFTLGDGSKLLELYRYNRIVNDNVRVSTVREEDMSESGTFVGFSR